MNRSRKQIVPAQAFTLIELLIVIAIVVLIVTLTVGSLMVLPTRARVRSTEGLISKLDMSLTHKLEAIQSRSATIPVTSVDVWLSGGSAQHAKMIALTRTLRQELPERFALSYPVPPNKPYPLHSPANNSAYPVLGDWSQIDLFNPFDSGGPNMNGPVQGTGELPTVARVFSAAMNEVVAKGTFATHDPKTTRAEALYLILAGSATGDSGVEFGPNEVDDTDSDGLKEFVDAFGKPIQFFLFPTHYTLPDASQLPKSNAHDPNQILTDSSAGGWWASAGDRRRPFERLFHSVSHPHYPYQTWLSPITSGTLPRSYGFRPLIISPGPDGALGLARGPGADGQPGAAGTDDDGVNGTDDIGELGWPGTDDELDLEHGVALRIANPSVEGYGQDQDNIDNLTLRAR